MALTVPPDNNVNHFLTALHRVMSINRSVYLVTVCTLVIKITTVAFTLTTTEMLLIQGIGTQMF